MAHGTVMVVEDDASIRDAVVEVLSVEGFAAVGVGNGEEALAHLRQGRERPAVILLDLMMPIMNGWEFRAEQLRDPTLAGIPVVVMSASDEARSDEAALAADARFRKPFEIAALLETLALLSDPPPVTSGVPGAWSCPGA